jgi:hypothetical protein
LKSTPAAAMITETPPLWVDTLGSGKLVTPWLRMQAEYLYAPSAKLWLACALGVGVGG